MENYLDSRKCSVTVVIATLGGPTLESTIEALNRGIVIPNEILICIPKDEASRLCNSCYSNVKVVATECRGQVAQRAIGFNIASNDYVMQLDDDLLVDERCVQSLLETLRISDRKTAVAPALLNIATGESVYKKKTMNRIFQRIYYWFMNGTDGYQPGRIDKSGTAVGIDTTGENGKIFNVEWLAGGCVMHHKENLVTCDFYPFVGKAYYEDVIHSYHLRAKGIGLKIDSGAICWLEIPHVLNYGAFEYLKYLSSDYRARKYSTHLYSKNHLRIYIFYTLNYLAYVCKKIINKF